jgi:phenylalanyl-tRNA synthetase beta chain
VLEFKPVSPEMQKYPVVQPYNLDRTALVSIKGGDFLGVIGEFKPSVTRSLKLPKYAAGFEVDTMVLQPLLAAGTTYASLSRFPKVTQDITLKVPAELPYQQLYEFIREESGKAVVDQSHIELQPLDIYQKAADSKHVTFRLTIASYQRTLTDTEVNKLLEAVAAAAKTKFGAERL